MRTNHVTAAVSAFVALLFLLAGPSASAGIIVTEGKVAQKDGRLTATAHCQAFESDSAGGDAGGPVASKDDDGMAGTHAVAESHDHRRPKGGGSDPSVDLGDLDGPPPAGWSCVDVGGGIEVCEPTGDPRVGAAPGAQEGGGLGVAGAGTTGGEDVLAGCQGTSDAAPVSWLLAPLAALLLLRRRR